VLTLRSLAGLSVPEIARAFLASEKTISQRLFRAKQRIRNTGIPFRVPPEHLRPERTSAVLAVLYLVFNEGYSSFVRGDLTAEAIRLTRVLASLMPDEPEPLGLLALIRLHGARRASRFDARGALAPLRAQDRSRWDREAIAAAAGLVVRAGRMGRPGPYQLQAAIAAVHDEAATAADTDWAQIALLYDELLRRWRSPVIELNRAVAIAMADGPGQGLELIDALAADGRLDGYHLLHSARADLLRRLERHEEACQAYRRARELAPSEAERAFLDRRIAELS